MDRGEYLALLSLLSRLFLLRLVDGCLFLLQQRFLEMMKFGYTPLVVHMKG